MIENNALGLHYRLVGKLVGLYFDDQGNPTKHLKGAEAKAARGAQLLKKQKKEEDKLPSCNSRWSQGEGGEVYILQCSLGVFLSASSLCLLVITVSRIYAIYQRLIFDDKSNLSQRKLGFLD